MADFRGRTAAEKRLAKRLGALGQEVYGELTDLLGNPPDLTKLTSAIWQDIDTRYQGAVRPELEKIFLDALDEFTERIGYSLDWNIANTSASEWARNYSYELVKGMNDTSRKMVQQSVADFFDRGLSIDDLRDKLGNVFGPVRAESIAITEVTRAVSQGEKRLADELGRQGVQMVTIWQTANDEKVCPICTPRHDKKQGDGWSELPPAHPRCRCYVSHEMDISNG